MDKIKFGTDGWRAIIADTYTLTNLKRVAYATAQWIKQQPQANRAVVAHDCRFGGELFTKTVVQVLAEEGIEVLYQLGMATTPMLAYATEKLEAAAGIIITASHNPPDYNGFKIKAHYGGPALPEMISAVEDLIPDEAVYATLASFDHHKQMKHVKSVDLEEIYISRIESYFDLAKINNSGFKVAYDAMFGSGQNTVKKILPNAVHFRCEENLGFGGTAPEPIDKNLKDFRNLILKEGNIDFAFANDGDADRIGVMDGQGNFIDSHHVILLLIHYLKKYQDSSGTVAVSFSCSGKIKNLCDHYGLKHQVTKIGFKYICPHILSDDVLVGGEESGGIAVKGHIPERDGIWVALMILEMMAKTGKNLQELIKEVYAITSSFAFERYDLHISQSQKEATIQACESNSIQAFGDFKVQSVDKVDGHKFTLDDNSWVMIRPSGTEPILRVYAESENQEKSIAILNATKALIETF